MTLKTIGLLLAASFCVAGAPLTGLAQETDRQASAAQSERPPLEEMPQRFQIAFWLNQAALAFDDQDYEDWAQATERLHALRPYNQDFMTHLVRAYAHQERFSEAYNMMLMMQQQGLAADWSQFEELEPMHEHRLYQHLSQLMNDAFQPFGEAREVDTLDQIEMPEALAHDPASGRLFIGGIRDGQILVSDGDGGDWQVFAGPDSNDELMAVLDLEVDSERGHLWVATAALTQFRGFREADQGRTALLKLDLETGEQLSSHRLIPDRMPHVFGSLAVAADGTVFAADTATPGIYRLSPGERHPQPFFGHPNFSSMRGIALSGDGSKLYLADYEVGIFVVDTADASRAWKLATPENLNEGGIDGLYWWDGFLVAIQNGINPERILRLKLGDDGLGVIEVAPLAASLPEFDTPTYGVMVGNELVFLANSHWHHVDARGRRTGRSMPPVHLMATQIDSARVLGVGQEMLEELLRRRGESQGQAQPEDDGEG
ncbi:SMP-30/gluconolactonase/LRE family protein [Wenzhouxiangella marina]|uniref:Uncharacterized protein n=1 Tax=Wenzhouxiangella marina TaxID=1579979 RepID=A0A0K0XSW4_9GAMM|nr:hypothetical protein [Wenzhouxiangella marina]AKS40778.1 hypothetical protein WM2015_395 [Wenzhouxiangella marina]MBB6087651.1 sugar lactone lactonase YvrE [Wenzhouxiangella marina]